MKLPTFIAIRYLRSKKSNAFLSMITALSMLGVAIGVAALIIILSVMGGFEGALKKRLAQGEFHILITKIGRAGEQYFPFPSAEVAKVFAQSPNIEAVNPVLTTEAILRTQKKVMGVSLRGISEAQTNSIAKSLIEADPSTTARAPTLSASGLWLGKDLAYELGIMPGEKVSIISPTETEGPMESIPRLRTFTVEGIYSSGIPEKDLHVVYGSMEAIGAFLQRSEVVNQVEVHVKDFELSPADAANIREVLGMDFNVKDWEQLNAHLFASLRIERITMFIILAIVVLVASFNIVTSLKMTVMEKRKEVGILKAMGATPGQIGSIFLTQGMFIGQVGTAIGLVLGLSVAFFLKHNQIIELPDIFVDRSLPVEISPVLIGFILITAFIIVTVAAYYPARSATRLSPLESIRPQ